MHAGQVMRRRTHLFKSFPSCNFGFCLEISCKKYLLMFILIHICKILWSHCEFVLGSMVNFACRYSHPEENSCFKLFPTCNFGFWFEIPYRNHLLMFILGHISKIFWSHCEFVLESTINCTRLSGDVEAKFHFEF